MLHVLAALIFPPSVSQLLNLFLVLEIFLFLYQAPIVALVQQRGGVPA